jgi:transposase-like protein
MPAPLDPDKREAIAQAIRDGGRRNEIARQHDVSPGTVSNVAREEGLTDAFDRTATERATAARNADVTARRSELKALLVEDAHRLRELLWEPCTVYKFGGKDNTLNSVDLEEPDFEGKRNLMTSVGIAVDKVEKLERLDLGGGIEEAAGLIRDLVDAIRGDSGD